MMHLAFLLIFGAFSAPVLKTLVETPRDLCVSRVTTLHLRGAATFEMFVSCEYVCVCGRERKYVCVCVCGCVKESMCVQIFVCHV